MQQELMEEKTRPNALAFKIAIVFSIYILVLMVIVRALGINLQSEDTPTLYKVVSGILNWAPFILAIYYVQITHKKELGGFITYGRGFSAGFKFAAYGGLFTGIFIFLYYQFIDQAGVQEIMDAALAKANGDENQIKGIEMMRPYFTISAAFGSAVMFTITGLIISLISAAVVKKERPLNFVEAEEI
ncbi:hypothetical protein ABIB40_000130 [Pedobacter sp. UYP30]|uniref:DUF4199 domain-containing protein n=1 Tax=Pedobacter sp. UYP30 TaxID=1756400 RepID=UPI003393C5EA